MVLRLWSILQRMNTKNSRVCGGPRFNEFFVDEQQAFISSPSSSGASDLRLSSPRLCGLWDFHIQPVFFMAKHYKD